MLKNMTGTDLQESKNRRWEAVSTRYPSRLKFLPLVLLFKAQREHPLGQKKRSHTQDCALAEPGGPWRLIVILRGLENLSFFIEIICWAHWISQVQSTGLPSIFFKSTALHTTVRKEWGKWTAVVWPTFPGVDGLSVRRDLNIGKNSWTSISCRNSYL